MKFNRIALVVALTLPAVAFAGVSVTPLIGYNSYKFAKEDMQDTFGFATKPKVAVASDKEWGGAVGVELTPALTFEAEYLRNRGHSSAFGKKQAYSLERRMSGNFLFGKVDTIGAIAPYGLIGAGVEDIALRQLTPAEKVTHPATTANRSSSRDTIGNIGAGVRYNINDYIGLRAEARAVRNFDNNWWELAALTGLQVTLGGHLTNEVPAPIVVAPVVVEPVVKVVEEVVVVTPPADSDNDGIIDAQDQCPNTPANVAVDRTGCPKAIVAPLNVELRVFFDTNKAGIKPQFKPEVTKAADALKAYPSATAKLEGHTDNRGSRALNNRLSLARANAVKSVLVRDYSIDAKRLSAEGFADTRPVASNDTAEGRAMNRRVYAAISMK